MNVTQKYLRRVLARSAAIDKRVDVMAQAFSSGPTEKQVLARRAVSRLKRDIRDAGIRNAPRKYVPPIVTTRATKMQHSRGALRELIVHVPSLGWEYFRYTYETPALGGRKAGSGKGSKFRICIDYATYTLAEILETYYTPTELEEIKRKHNVK